MFSVWFREFQVLFSRIDLLLICSIFELGGLKNLKLKNWNLGSESLAQNDLVPMCEINLVLPYALFTPLPFLGNYVPLKKKSFVQIYLM